LHKISARHCARLAVVQGLYQQEQTDQNSQQIAKEFLEFRFEEKEDTINPAPDRVYFQKLIEAIPEKLILIDAEIQNYLGDKWKVERLSSVVRALLRCACYELMFEPLVPTAVVLNEYIEVGRSFLDEREIKFINGILDNIAKSVRK
jgi:N utilization substance protein B